MKKQIKYRVLSIVLSICIAGTLFTGCGKEVSEKEVSTEEAVVLDEANTEAEEEVKKAEEERIAEEEAKKAEEAKIAEEEAKKAEEEAKRIEEEAIKAEEEAKKAQEEAIAEEERLKAEAEAKKAEEDRIKAEEETKKAEAEAKKAEEERLKAEAEAKKAEEEAKKAEQEAQLAAEELMDETQKNSLNMLNYLTVLTQEINDSKGSRLYVENAYSSLINNTFPNAVDSRTQGQLTNILDTLEHYRMVDVKRERLEFMYEQNKAQAIRSAVPNPLSVLNVVQSGNFLKATVSVLYMAVDSYSSYEAATEKADLEYLKDGWELDDEEAAELHNSRKQAFTYMLSMVRDNNLPGEYALSEDAVSEFVDWKNNTTGERRISFLESNQSTYEAYGTYWLTLAESYYQEGEYKKCLDSVKKYEEVSSKIFRKDYEYAKVLPMAIVSAREIYGKDKYISVANEYAEAIIANTDKSDWAMTYFVAQIYLDLYSKTSDKSYGEKAYQIARENVNNLVNEQKELNKDYLAEVNDVETPKDASKREKEEIKQFNKLQKAEREIALPPVSEALYLNCDLLFALADELGKDNKEKNKVDSILHENGESIFLLEELDNRFWFASDTKVTEASIDLQFDGENIVIPATYVSERYSINVTVDNAGTKTQFTDWNIDKVTRKKNTTYKEFEASFSSETAKKFKYSDGMKISVVITPINDAAEKTLTFEYKVSGVKKAFVFNGLQFERVK